MGQGEPAGGVPLASAEVAPQARQNTPKGRPAGPGEVGATTRLHESEQREF